MCRLKQAAMDGILKASREGDMGEVERLLEQDPRLLNSEARGLTPLMCASWKGHVGVVQFLMDKGAGVNHRPYTGGSALSLACHGGRFTVVELLLERGADPTVANQEGATPLLTAGTEGHVDVVLLTHASAAATMNHRDRYGKTALWWACYWGRGGVVRALLESGADPMIPDNFGIYPLAVAKRDPEQAHISAEGGRECVAALEVRICLPVSPSPNTC
jgi:ankyrin repeat protein